MNKKKALEILKKESETILHMIEVVSALETKKIYKLEYESWSWDRGLNKLVANQTTTIIFKVKNFNKESVRIVPLAIETLGGSGLEWEIRNELKAGKREPETSLELTNISNIEEWGTIKDHINEGPLFVNYDYLSDTFKKGLFGTN